jgi:hypothetical protein
MDIIILNVSIFILHKILHQNNKIFLKLFIIACYKEQFLEYFGRIAHVPVLGSQEMI